MLQTKKIDYSKFFGLLDPEFAWASVAEAGFPQDLATHMTNFAENATRYLKFSNG